MFIQSAPFVEVLITLQKKCSKGVDRKKEKYLAAVDLDKRRTEQTSRNCFRCGSEDNLIAKCTNPPKDNEKRRKQVRFNEKGNRSCYKRENISEQRIYAYMACMSSNDECLSGNFGDSSQLTNWILDSVATCHMIAEVSYFIPGSLEDTDKQN